MTTFAEPEAIDVDELRSLVDAAAHRRSLVALHVAGRKEFGDRWDEVRCVFVLQGSHARTGSAAEATTAELDGALAALKRWIEDKPDEIEKAARVKADAMINRLIDEEGASYADEWLPGYWAHLVQRYEAQLRAKAVAA